MENRKINIAEILRACPKGMELDCTMYCDCIFDGITNDEDFPINCRFGTYITRQFTKYGGWDNLELTKCVIFPKGKTTWEGFTTPCKFKDGDILSYQYKGFENRTIYIYMYHNRMNTTYYVALSGNSDSEFMINDKKGYALDSYNDTVRLATEEEKQKLFQAIKDNGYKWDAEKKCLEKLKADKFDITTLIPFESKVLMRENDNDCWRPAWYGYKNDINKRFYAISAGSFRQCVPYKGNEHLLGTTEDCDSYFKTWED